LKIQAADYADFADSICVIYAIRGYYSNLWCTLHWLGCP